MTPERWQQVEGIYHAALEQTSAERASFLDQACGGDPDLRAEVESLIAAQAAGAGFLEAPALEIAAHALAAGVPLLASGRRLGSYTVTSAIAAGGMGEVWRARDTALGRDVAIKVLPAIYSRDPDRLRRFEQEAYAAGQLNHPNILTIYAVGSEAGAPYLVTELLEGETLEARLRHGALPPRKAIEYAVQIAQGLAAAHEKGIVHRDLKPANLFVTPDGRVKILDFGLAKLTASVEGPTDQARSASGIILGTVGYMSPEQVRGQAADHRADLFSFGTILYEMLAGARAFSGESPVEAMNAILQSDPVPLVGVSPALERIVRHCLENNPGERFQSARDLAFHLDAARESSGIRGPVAGASRTSRKLVGLALAALVILAIAATAFTIAYVRRAPGEEPAVRFSFSPPTELKLAETRYGGPVAISPDGRRLVFVATGSDGRQLLWIQPLEALGPQSLPGTDGATYPFWSPDSRSVGFFANGRLKRIDAAGGPAQTMCDAVLPRGGTWNRAGVIVFSAGAGEQLYQVSAAGGVPTPLTFTRRNRESLWPAFLPDGRHFVYFGRRAEPGVFVASLESGEPAKLLTKGLYVGAVYAAPGYLLFFKGGSVAGTLLAQPLDLKRLELSGEPVSLAEQVPFYPLFGLADFSVSDTGTLVYGTLGLKPTSLIWFDRGGKQLARIPGASGYARPVLSPDETLIAADHPDPETQSPDVWLIDATRGDARRLTTNPGLDIMGQWSPDGRHIVYGSTREDNGSNSYMKPLSGTGVEQPVFTSDNREVRQLTDWSRDGTLLAYARLDPKTQWDLWTMPIVRDRAGPDENPVPYLQTEFSEHDGQFSPDGRWMAYTSNESGKWEVYVGAFPTAGTRGVRVSTDGGIKPAWRRDGKELFYQAPGGMLMSVTVQPDGSFGPTAPRALFKMPVEDRATQAQHFFDSQYLPANDGQRFLINAVTEGQAPPAIRVVLHWTAMLRR